MTDRVAALVERAIAAHPRLIADRGDFAAHLSTILGEDSAHAERGAALHAEDLALAYACARGVSVAIELLETTAIATVRAALLARWDEATVDDTLQLLRQRFVLGDGDGPPRLLGYAGRGPLAAWLRVAAIRIAIDGQRQVWRELPLEQQLVAEPAATSDPARAEREVALRRALREAIAALPSASRALLRYYYSDGVGVAELGRIYRVAGSTISRRLAQARNDIFERTRAVLAQRLAVAPSQVDSVLGLAGSLEIDLDSLLRSRP